MNVIVPLEHRFHLGEDGEVYTENDHTSGYSFFRRYLDVFDAVTVVARLGSGGGKFSKFPVAGPGVSFQAVPYFHGPWEFFRQAPAVRTHIRRICRTEGEGAAFISRSPGTVGSLLIRELRRTGYPYGMEVVQDPYEVFAPGALRHPLRPLFRRLAPRQLRKQCAGACAVSYVTANSLQRRYPPAEEAFATHYSSIELEADAFRATPLPAPRGERPTLIFVGSLEHLYKGQDVLIDAVGLCLARGGDLQLVMVGEGRRRPDLERQAGALGLSERVHFTGHLPSGEAVRQRLDQADLFVLPSISEGLPRAMIEAMARGLPCLGTAIVGIPELLPAEDLVPPGRADLLADKIMEVLPDPERRQRMALRNLAAAREFENTRLRRRRAEFYRQVRDRTAAFARQGGERSGKEDG